MASGNSWNEITGAAKLQELRSQQQHYTGPSFPTISAFGPNGAIIHYRPHPDTNRQITTESLYLLDSGGQYKGEYRSPDPWTTTCTSVIWVSLFWGVR